MMEAIDNLRLAILHVEDRRAELDRAGSELHEADMRFQRVQRELDEAYSERQRALEQYTEAVKAAHPWLPVNKFTDNRAELLTGGRVLPDYNAGVIWEKP